MLPLVCGAEGYEDLVAAVREATAKVGNMPFPPAEGPGR